jgi:hypothetical protein
MSHPAHAQTVRFKLGDDVSQMLRGDRPGIGGLACLDENR